MNILFLGSNSANSRAINLCINNCIPFLAVTSKRKGYTTQTNIFTRSSLFKEEVVEKRNSQEHYHFVLDSVLFNFAKFNDWLLDKKFKPDLVINTSDSIQLLRLEKAVNDYYNCASHFDEFTLDFFTEKKFQQKVCDDLHIPTPNPNSDTLIVKRNFLQHQPSKIKVPKIRAVNNDYIYDDNYEFAQEWVDIQHIYNCDVYIDSYGNWYFTRCNKMLCDKSIPYFAYEPYFPSSKELDKILSILTPFKDALKIKKRFIMFQLMKRRNSEEILYQECNARPSYEFNWIRNHKRSTYDPFSLLIFDKSIPNAFTFDKILHSELLWNRFRQNYNNIFDLDIWYDITQNINAKEAHDGGVCSVIKL